MKYLTQNLQLKSIDENGEISGYASVFKVIDGYHDSVEKGAFANSIRKFKSGKRPKLLWQHDGNSPIGVITDIYEDGHGLFMKAKLLLEIPKAREAYALLKNRAIDGFSIGYRIKNDYFGNNVHYLTDIELMEVSIVTFPACEDAVVGDVKSDDDKPLNDTHNLTESVDFCSAGSLRRYAPLDGGNFRVSRHSEARRAVGIQKKENQLLNCKEYCEQPDEEKCLELIRNISTKIYNITKGNKK